MAEGARECVVAARVDATFEALRDAVRERKLSLVEEDQRHLRLTFRLDHLHEGRTVRALCAVLDIGDGRSKVVVVCVDDVDGSVTAPDASVDGLLAQLEHRSTP
jgi:hypothetical protein